MLAISFSIFKEKIISGEKRQTIRKMRRRPIKEGDILYLYWKQRTKESELLKKVKCNYVRDIRIRILSGAALKPKMSFIYDQHYVDVPELLVEQISKKDGFKNSFQLQFFLMERHGLKVVNESTFQMIRWGFKEIAS